MNNQKTDIIAKFKSELSKVYDGELQIEHQSFDYFKNGKMYEQVMVNKRVSILYQLGKEEHLINAVPDLARALTK